MVPGSLWESGISDVVFPGTFGKVPWVIFAFPDYFGNCFWYVLVSGKFRKRSVICGFGNRTSETISGRPDYAVDWLWMCFIYKMWVFPWFGTCRNCRRKFPSFWVDKKQRRCCPIFRKSRIVFKMNLKGFLELFGYLFLGDDRTGQWTRLNANDTGPARTLRQLAKYEDQDHYLRLEIYQYFNI
ncbi:putative proline-rich receptor-like protein kinase PERK8 [Iris pallida]|uniref:Proline-rich receptor-like protein kinase PERK8 n=1 Tax=Iris pallida TaxID=29817 RepID=A0AAX6IKF0_IRIPA|nr:putative proline-rich receptor-like protein kinase PERK8 [Iris pallida]